MTLLKYFKKTATLPDPKGPISSQVPPSSIASANKEVKHLLERSTGKARSNYSTYTDEEKVKIARRAVEMGATNTIKYFQKEFVERPLKESTVRTWMNKYKAELAERRKFDSEMKVSKLPSKKRGHPLIATDTRVNNFILSHFACSC